MKNKYSYNNKKIKDIIFIKYKKMFLMDDNSTIPANGTSVQIFCKKCQKYVKINFANRYEKKEFICNSCRLSGENNPFFGKKHSEEFKRRLSQERKGVYFVGEKNPMYGKRSEDFMSEEAIKLKRLKQSLAFKGEKNPMYGKTLKSVLSEEKYEKWKRNVKEHGFHSFSFEKQQEIRKKISDRQKKLKENDPIGYSKMKAKGGIASKNKAVNYKKTKPEIKVEQYLIQNNVNYDYSCIMGSGKRCFQYDFIIHKKRILIEVQGNYWHGDPNKYNNDGTDGKRKLNDTQKQNIEKDLLKKQFAEEKGFKIIYIWETEINNNNFSKLQEIL